MSLAFGACGDGGDGGDARAGSEAGPNPCGSCPEMHYCSYGQCVADPGIAEGKAQCDIYGFEPTAIAGFARFAGGETRLRVSISNIEVQPPFEKIVLEINQDTLYDGEPAPGTYSLVDTSAKGAPLFTRGYSFCNDVSCAFTYFVEAGEVEISAPGVPGSRFKATIRDLRLKQMRLSESGEIIPFNSGKVWCFGDLNIDVEVPSLSSAEGSCVTEGTGMNLGDNIRNFTLTNCYGDPVDLHTRCGKSEAVWIVATAGWCGACEAFVPVAAERYKARAGDGLDLMVVIGENRAAAAPSVEYCMDYALAKGLDPAQTFIDNNNGRSWDVLFGAVNTYSGGSIGLPWNLVMDGRSMEYIWSSNAGGGELYGVQDDLMSRE